MKLLPTQAIVDCESPSAFHYLYYFCCYDKNYLSGSKNDMLMNASYSDMNLLSHHMSYKHYEIKKPFPILRETRGIMHAENLWDWAASWKGILFGVLSTFDSITYYNRLAAVACFLYAKDTSILSPLIPILLVVVPAYTIWQKSLQKVYENHPVLYIMAFGMVSVKITSKLVACFHNSFHNYAYNHIKNELNVNVSDGSPLGCTHDKVRND